MVTAGLCGAAATLGCGAGFVAAVVRADRRAGSPTGLRGAPRRWLAACAACATGTLLLLGAVVVR